MTTKATTEQAESIFQLMPKIMGAIGAIGKGRENVNQHYKFRGIEDVFNAVQPALVKYGVVCIPEVLASEQTERHTAKGTVMMHTFITARHTFYAPDGSNVSAITIGEGMDIGDKSANKAMSAAFKYAIFETFCIPTEGGSIDSEVDTPEIGKPTAKKTPVTMPTPIAADGKSKKLSPEQRKLLFAAAAEVGLKGDNFKAFLGTLGITSTKDILSGELDALLKEIANAGDDLPMD